MVSPAGEVEAAGGSLLAAGGFFRTTRDPRAPLPLSVPTLRSQLSDLAFFTPVPDVPCSTHNTSVISPLTCSSITSWMWWWHLPDPLQACRWWGCLSVCHLHWISLEAKKIRRRRRLCLWVFSRRHVPASLWGCEGHVQVICLTMNETQSEPPHSLGLSLILLFFPFLLCPLQFSVLFNHSLKVHPSLPLVQLFQLL